jgi:hypothetical protein
VKGGTLFDSGRGRFPESIEGAVALAGEYGDVIPHFDQADLKQDA